jgi:RimJ/RimL family protein N-acetyltransferase
VHIEPVTLEGTHVRLEPLALKHHEALAEIGLEEELWRWTPNEVRTSQDMLRYIETALAEQARGVSLPFAVFDRARGCAAGSTRYMNIDMANRRAEIGSTWYGRDWRRTAVNTECKYLLLCHAFEALGAMRVEFKTDSLNTASRNALLRIGAIEEGTFRNHMMTYSGRIRHTVYFSIINDDWPAVKGALERKLSR